MAQAIVERGSLKNSANPRILIVRVGAMGDVLHGMPAVAALRSALPGAALAWAVEPRWAPLLQASIDAAPRTRAMPLLDRVHLVPTKAWSRAPFSLATAQSIVSVRRELRDVHYDLAIDLQGSIRSATIARMSGAAQVTGNAKPREMPARLLYTQRVSVTATHVVPQAVEIVSAAVGMTLAPQHVDLPHDPVAEDWCDMTLGTDSRPVVFLAPTAGWGAKEWPVANFAEVAVACSRAGLRVLVNKAGPNDSTADALLHAAKGLAAPVDCSISQLIALIRRVSLVIAGDTGPLHLAAALGRPSVALFGPTDPARNGPYSAPACVLRDAESITSHRRNQQTERGLARIPVDEVLLAASDLLGIPIRPTHMQ